MQTNPFIRRLAVAVFVAAAGACIPAPSPAQSLPALNDPATAAAYPGKFEWAELFTDDAAAASRFYTGVFGWTVSPLKDGAGGYATFRNAGQVVAGLRERTPKSETRAARWVAYIAVPNLKLALSEAKKAGGTVRAPARNFSKLGRLAIITDNEGSPVGLIQSGTGDLPEDEPATGTWNWFHLLAKDPASAADFYKRAFGFEVNPDAREGRTDELILSNGPVNRASISTLQPGDDGGKPGWLGVIRVADIEQAVAKATSYGGQVIVEPREASLGSRFAVVLDPTGGAVGLVQYVNNANPANPHE